MRRSNWTPWAQGLIVALSIALVAAFVVSMLLGGVTGGRDVTPAPTAPSTQTPPELQADDPKPGVPVVPVAEHEYWPVKGERNPDRQLSYAPTGTPTVDLPDALGADLESYWTQSVVWAPCGDASCADVVVPLDWEKPAEAGVSIALTKLASRENTLGTIFVNPGGPGFGGADFARYLGTDFFKGYDLVGWDPRGTGESTTVQCGSTEETDALMGIDTSPDDDAERTALKEASSSFAQQCRNASGDLLDHLTTIENVRDLDLIRHLLGEDKVNLFGVSYGTYVGAGYAELFPERVGRMILDSAVDITDGEDAPSQAEGFELALKNFADWCAGTDDCTLGDSTEGVMSKIDEFLKGLDADPVAVGDRELTQSLATSGVARFLYSDEQLYPYLAGAIVEAMSGRGDALLMAADEQNGRTDSGWDTSTYAFPATRCADWYDEGIAAAYDYWDEAVQDAPVFAGNSGTDLVCETWTADAGPELKITAKGAAPILVVGTTGDSATPYEDARTMAAQLESGVLVTFEGAGHGSITSGNQCLTDIADKYFVDGEVPADGVTCS